VLDARFFGKLAVLDINFFQGFDMLGDKADRHHH
jgi:hypothetical protein